MPNYEEARVKLINTQLKQLKSTVKYKTGATFRITTKNFCGISWCFVGQISRFINEKVFCSFG